MAVDRSALPVIFIDGVPDRAIDSAALPWVPQGDRVWFWYGSRPATFTRSSWMTRKA